MEKSRKKGITYVIVKITRFRNYLINLKGNSYGCALNNLYYQVNDNKIVSFGGSYYFFFLDFLYFN
jgi:hypothetical protein